jgi:hypothetical protein
MHGTNTLILYTLYSILYTLYSILYTLYSILYTLYSILYSYGTNTVYSILYTLYPRYDKGWRVGKGEDPCTHCDTRHAGNI